MTLHLRMIGLCIAAGVVCVPGSAIANATQHLDNTWDFCLERTRAEERAKSIPEHLLTAISLAESGRWSQERRENLAWPWTVTAEGQGRFLPTKAAAITEVRALQARGVSNIDVGCMQVNLRYHPGAFAGLEEAFDPARNVAYAATHLGRLFESSGSWQEAAADYHSTTPEFHDAYQAKVTRLWSEQAQRPATLGAGGDADAQEDVEDDDGDQAGTSGKPADRPIPRIVPVDHARTALLNTRLQALRAGERVAPRMSVRERRLQSLEGAGALLRGQRPVADAHRIDVENRQRQASAIASSGFNGADFADRRQAQLREWRTRRAGSGSF